MYSVHLQVHSSKIYGPKTQVKTHFSGAHSAPGGKTCPDEVIPYYLITQSARSALFIWKKHAQNLP